MALGPMDAILGPMDRQIQSYDRSLWAAILFYDPGASRTMVYLLCPLPGQIQNHLNFVDILIRSRDICEKPRQDCHGDMVLINGH
jgi:hypothetical protein